MRKFSLAGLSATIACVVIWGADWASQSGNPQRDGWAKSEKAFTRDNARTIELLYKFKAENQVMGLQSLTSPIINGMLITYLGFKEMLVFGGSGDNVYSVDADLNRLIWRVHLDYKGDRPRAAPTALCPGGMTAGLAMPGSSTAAGRGFGLPPGRGVPGRGNDGRGGRGVAGPPGLGPPGRGNAGLFATGFGRAGVFVVVSGDGYLHALNTSTGADRIPPLKFLPPNARASSLNIDNGVIYAATENNCGGNLNALYALDMSGPAASGEASAAQSPASGETAPETPKIYALPTKGGAFTGVAATAIGNDGTVYAQVTSGQDDLAGQFSYTVLAMSKDLKIRDYFTPPGAAPAHGKDIPERGVTPVVFTWKEREMLVAGGPDGRLYLLDAKSLGGADHRTPLYQTEPFASPDTNYAGNGFEGTFSSWEDTDKDTRWVYASLWGPPGASAKFAAASDRVAPHGSVAAFKMEESNGQPILTPQWVSRDMLAPAPPATANGLVFALSTGESAREAKENGKPYTVAEREKLASRATLYVLDGETGDELYSSGNIASTFTHGSGLAVANRRIYFTTHDNTVYAFGFLAEQPQLTGK
jgi:outer membrane protein assembly factor BamB